MEDALCMFHWRFINSDICNVLKWIIGKVKYENIGYKSDGNNSNSLVPHIYIYKYIYIYNIYVYICQSWWRHEMETFSTLLALCAGNSPVPGEFPAQRPVTRSFDVFFDLRPNKRLSKQSWGWRSRPLWRHRVIFKNWLVVSPSRSHYLILTYCQLHPYIGTNFHDYKLFLSRKCISKSAVFTISTNLFRPRCTYI